MEVTTVERLFQTLDETASLLEKELDCTYLDALIETGENVFQNKVLQPDVSEMTVKRLEKAYDEINRMSYTREDIRKAFQLACLKGMRKNVQPHHQMTPDTIGFLLSYLIGKFLNEKRTFTILDIAVGTGNLLTTILNQLPNSSLKAYGVELDELLIKIAYVNANLQEHSIQLYNQDSLKPLLIDPVDLVVSDLPVGYYPNKFLSEPFELTSSHDHSFIHYLMIEQGMKYTKPGGYLFFIIPNNLFEGSESKQLHTFIKKHLHIQALFQLPSTMFKDGRLGKSILILQKNGEGVKPPKEVLLANLPSLKDKDAVESIMVKINRWFMENKREA
ncbi:class I SAM-dependent methyltransferase [Fervidibacillus halotolerans]|uniref:Class I SAM-dependent methyltransferase n=1 Tax=Fervidibacillus halotolerans TaxID=2980027 RepID=A0A9E8RXY4_9BACI|nr:class I SAM-dependent methyltransferase [Fervidibacillus halotolerans]WAA11684.1 class I SAM-dependent methyltransferase [Fervidibacillus halotolerans]